MISLCLSILMGVVVKIVYKYIEGKDIDGDSVMVINYVATIVIALAFCLNSGIFGQVQSIKMDSAGSALAASLQGALSVEASIIWCAFIAFFQAIMLVYNFLATRKGIIQCGASMTTAFSSIGNMLTVLLSILIFREFPGIIQWIGIILAFGAMILSNLEFGAGIKWNFRPILLMITGMCCLMGIDYKFIQTCVLPKYDNLFLLFSFSLSLFLSLFYFRKKKCRYGIKEVIFGIIIGIPNIACSYFLINSLKTLPATVVYPINSAGSIVVTCIICSFIFKERLKKNELAAIGMTIAGVVLINLS